MGHFRDRTLATKEFYFLYITTGLLASVIFIGVYLSFWPFTTWPDSREEYLPTLGDFWKDAIGNNPMFIASRFVSNLIYKINRSNKNLAKSIFDSSFFLCLFLGFWFLYFDCIFWRKDSETFKNEQNFDDRKNEETTKEFDVDACCSSKS